MRRPRVVAIGFVTVICTMAMYPAIAQPVLSFEPLSTQPGDTTVLKLRLTEAVEASPGINVKFALPSGVSVSFVNPGDLLTDSFTIDSYTYVDEGVTIQTALAYSSLENIPVQEGTLLEFGLVISNDPFDLGLDGMESLEVEVAFLGSGVVANDGDTSTLHAARNGVMVFLQELVPILDVTPVSHTVPITSGSASFFVENAGVDSINWIAGVIEGGDWLSIDSGLSGVDAGEIRVSFTSNLTGEIRTASVLVDAGDSVLRSPAVVTVMQEGDVTGNIAVLSVAPGQQTVNADATAAEFSVANLGVDSMPWVATVIEGDEWASIESGAAGIDDGIIRLRFPSNLSSETRSLRLQVEATGAVGSPTTVTLVQRGTQFLEVIAPSGVGDNWGRGTTQTVLWTTGGTKQVEAVSIVLLKGGNLNNTISLVTDNSGEYLWTVPADMVPGDDYRVQIVDVTHPAIHAESNEYFGISCPPNPPENLTATAGQLLYVEVTWDIVDTAIEYEVYRSEADDVATAELVHVTEDTSFIDFDALPPKGGGFGCARQPSYRSMFYWVKSVNTCKTSDFGEVATGYRGYGLEGQFPYVDALPNVRLDGQRYVGPHSTLYIRLLSDEVIDVDSVYGDVVWSNGRSEAVSWLPISESDGWMVFVPDESWPIDDVLEVTVGGQTIQGDVLVPIIHEFVVADVTLFGELVAKDTELLTQPASVEFGDADLVFEAAQTTALVAFAQPDAIRPVLSGAVGDEFVIVPEQAFDEAQRLWFQVPDGVDPESVDVWFCHTTETGSTWYPAANVEGWLVPDSRLLYEYDGANYLGILVRHSGVVQLAVLESDVAGRRASSILPGDAIILMLLAFSLFGAKAKIRN